MTVKCRLKNKRVAKIPISVRLPNNHLIQNTHEALLPIPGLPESARLARFFPQLTSASLISIAQLCDAGCKAIFDKDTVKITKNGKVVLQGHRNPVNNLWEIILGRTKQDPKPTSPPRLHINNIDYSLCNVFRMSSIANIINYLHGACFYPVKSTWLAAIERGAFATWPYITYQAVQKHLLPSPNTSKGHMKQTPSNLRSTKEKPSGKPNASTSHKPYKVPTLKSLLQATINLANKLDTTKTTPLQHPNIQQAPSVTWYEQSEVPDSNTAQPRTNEVFIKLFDMQSTMYSDQTGAFPCSSS